MLSNAISAGVNLSSPQSAYTILNHFRLLALLLLTYAYFPQDIVDYFSGMKIASFSFSFIPMNLNLGLSTISGVDSSALDDKYMNAAGVNYSSIIYNCMSLLSTFITFGIFHAAFLLIRRLLKKLATQKRIVGLIINKIYGIMTFAIYVRTLMEANQFLLICSTYEIRQLNRSSFYHIVSLIIAFLVYIGMTVFAVGV